jgi:hypothetical protein
MHALHAALQHACMLACCMQIASCSTACSMQNASMQQCSNAALLHAITPSSEKKIIGYHYSGFGVTLRAT